MPFTPDRSDPAIIQVRDAIEYLITDGQGGGSRTFYTTKIASAPGFVDLNGGQTVAAGKTVKLHALYLTANIPGTVLIQTDTDGADGGTEVALTGAMNVAANGGFVIPFTSDPDGCLSTANDTNHHLTLEAVTCTVAGWAVISIG